MKSKYLLSAALVFSLSAASVSAQERNRTDAGTPSPTQQAPIKLSGGGKGSTGGIKPEGQIVGTAPSTQDPKKVEDKGVSGGVLPSPVVKEVPTEYKKSKSVVEDFPKGKVDWTQQFVEAEGTGIINTERFKNPAQARAMAQRAAIVDAQRNLLEIVKGVDITSETSVKDLMLESDEISTSVQGIIRGARQVGKAKVVEGAVIVKMRVPLYDENGLGPVVVKGMEEHEAAHPEQKAEVSPLVGGTQASLGNSLVASNGVAGEGMKNVAFNLLNGKLNPQMFPVVYDKEGKVVFDLKKIYDPSKGQFPKLLQAGKEIMGAAGFSKGTEVIDIIQQSDGKFVLADTQKSSTWQKIGNIAATVGKFLLMLL